MNRRNRARWRGRVPLRPATPPLLAAPALRADTPPSPTQIWQQARRAVVRHRRLLAAGCVALAVAAALDNLAPRKPPTASVVIAARDLTAGAVLVGTDLGSAALPLGAVPAGVFTATSAVIGRQLSGPMRRGEPLTDVRLDDGPLGRPAPGLVAAPVRFADLQAARLLRPGERVDVLAATIEPTGWLGPVTALAVIVAAGVSVVAIPSADAAGPSAAGAVTTDGSALEGALVILATTPTQARALAQAQISARLSAVVVR